MVPRAVYRDVHILFPCFLMIQVAPTTDVPRSAFWTVRFPSHFPAMAEQPVSVNTPMMQTGPASENFTPCHLRRAASV